MSPLMRIVTLFVVMGVAIFYKNVHDAIKSMPVPDIPLNQWWGDGEAPEDWEAYLANTSEVISNKLEYPQETIDELHYELSRPLRLSPPLEGVAFEYGFNSEYLKEVIRYWRDDYLPRWRSREVFLWPFNHFTTEIQGLRMHFLHVKFYEGFKFDKQHYPVLLLHGWPGSVREFYTFIHLLYQTEPHMDNKYIFDIVVPSLPGFGWSQGTSKPGLGCAEIAVIMRNLMLRLGYEKFFVQGGDWGSLIGSHMATLFPENVLGYHSNMCSALGLKAQIKGVFASYFPTLFAPSGYEDLFFPRSEKFRYTLEESGYFHLQATKPDTIGNALTNNPVGLAAYILEKFSTWTNANYRKLPKGGLNERYKMDDLLDNIMIYYLTNSITTSQRIYAESYSAKQLALALDRVPTLVPTGCARFRHDILHSLDFQLQDKYHNLIHSTYYKDGGHFAALEVPLVLYHDFLEFVKKVEHQMEIINRNNNSKA